MSQNSQKLTYSQLLDGTIKLITWATDGQGVSAAIVIPDKGCWQGTAGFSYDDQPLTEKMVFNIASVGKNFLAVLILQLVEEKILSLNDSIGRWLPEYTNIDNSITIRQLLNHTSGLSDWVRYPTSPFMISFDSIKFDKWWNWDEILNMVNKPVSPPAQNWFYSTTNYNLLRRIAEKTTGHAVDREITDRLILPLGLKNTFICDSVFSLPENIEVAHGWYDANQDGIPEDISYRPQNWIISLSPAMIYSDAADLARWSSNLYCGKLLNPDIQKQMLDFYHPTPGEPPVTGYGLGTAEFANPVIKSLKAYGHLGYHYGYMTAMMYFPVSQISMSIMINSNNMVHISAVAIGLWYITELMHSWTTLLITMMIITYITKIFILPFFLIVRKFKNYR